MKLKIYLENGAPYIVDENGDIERTDMVFTASGKWKFMGFIHVHKKWACAREAISQELLNGITWLYKNGHPQFTGVDLDHGTTRVWGNRITKIEII